jgi:predicted transcriptional regulator
VLAPASETAEDLGARRRRVGISQQRLATLAGCSLASVRTYEYGYTPVASPTLARVLEVLATLEAEEQQVA